MIHQESACNAGDLEWILGSGRSSGEGNGYQLQYSFFFNSNILAWRILWTEKSDGLQSMGSQRVRYN